MELETNNKLASLYESLRSKMLPCEIAKKLFAPLLMKVGDKWETDQNKILIVGQEPLGWEAKKEGIKEGIYDYSDFLERPDSVKKLMDYYYEEFCFAKSSKNKSSPFWQAFRRIAGKGIQDLTANSNVIWTNLVKSSYDVTQDDAKLKIKPVFKMSEKLRNEILAIFKGLLAEEIKILKPTKIIFFTGPYYDKILKGEFPKAEFYPYKTWKVRELANVSIEESIRAIRTYHPGYIRRSKQRWQTIIEDEICNDFI